MGPLDELGPTIICCGLIEELPLYRKLHKKMSESQNTTTDLGVPQMIAWGSLFPRTAVAKFLAETSLILLVCACVLAPNVTLRPTWPFVRTETLMLVFFVVVYGWLLLAGLAKPFRPNAFYGIGLLFSVCTTVSVVYGTAILNHELLYRDLFEIPKAYYPVAFFAFAYEAEISEKGLARLLNYYAVAAALVCLYGWAQFLRLGIANRFNPYYTDFGHNYLALVKYNRILSTMANPNCLGQLMSWTLCIYLLAFLFDVGSRARNVGISLMCVITVALTGSRYGLLASALGLFLIMWLSFSARSGVGKLIVLMLVVTLSYPVFIAVSKNSYWAAKRFEALKNPLQVDSVRGRLDVLWLDAGGYFLSSPWVGHGPVKKIFDGIYTDSEYLDILKWYGIAGLIVYLGYYFWPLHEIYKTLKRLPLADHQFEEQLKANLVILRAGFVIFILALFMNIGESTYWSFYLVGFLWTWCGLAVRASHFVAEVEAQHGVRSVTAPYRLLPRPACKPFSWDRAGGAA